MKLFACKNSKTDKKANKTWFMSQDGWVSNGSMAFRGEPKFNLDTRGDVTLSSLADELVWGEYSPGYEDECLYARLGSGDIGLRYLVCGEVRAVVVEDYVRQIDKAASRPCCAWVCGSSAPVLFTLVDTAPKSMEDVVAMVMPVIV